MHILLRRGGRLYPGNSTIHLLTSASDVTNLHGDIWDPVRTDTWGGMGQLQRSEILSRLVPLALMFLIILLGVAIPLGQGVSQAASESATGPCGGDARVYVPTAFPMNCSGTPASLEIQNTLSSDIVLKMEDSGGVALGPILPTSNAPYTTDLFNAIEGSTVIGPGDEQSVTYGSDAGSFTTEAAPGNLQRLSETLSLVGGYLPVGLVGYAAALKSADHAWTTEDANYFSCLGANPDKKQTALCSSKLLAEVGATDASLASSTGIQMSGSLKKSISAALAQVNIAAFTHSVLQQFKDLIPADLTATIVAGTVGVGSKSHVLILGDGDSTQDPGYTSFSFLATSLSTIGLTITTLPGTTTLPSNLSGYGQIWWDGTQNLSPHDERTLESFVEAGGSVYINGNYGVGGLFDNQSVLDITQALVSSSISVSGIDGGPNPIPVNATVNDEVATAPNPLTTWSPSDEGTLTGVATPNTLFPEGYGASGAVWDVGQSGGRLAVLMSVEWAESTDDVQPTATQVAENLGFFLSD